MAIIKILQYPDPRLRQIGTQVEDFGSTLQKIVDDMFETHYAQENCAALAATQLDFQDPKKITVIDFSEKKNEPLCLINPIIIKHSGEQEELEGCMSVGLDSGMIFEKIKRAAKITVQAQDRYGKPLLFEAEGFMAKCIQHEFDHLNGKLFIDYLSPLKRNRIEKRLRKNIRHFKKK